jgi:acyl dehydratase
MPIDYKSLMAMRWPEYEAKYSEREAMLYALGVGFGADPLDEAELPFVYEKSLKTVPTMATMIAWQEGLSARTGVNRVLVVHGEQRVRLHQPLPPAASVVAATRVVEAIDKGKDKGAVIVLETTIREKSSGQPLCTNLSSIFARGDGGFGGPSSGGLAPHALPDRAPDAVAASKTLPNQALLYRLSGDRNPLHSDPSFAKAAGFPRPILQGLGTFGIACRAVLKTMCDYDHTRIIGFDARFSAPVFPGETIRTEIWRDGNIVSFRAKAVERDVLVLNNGKATLNGA